MNGLRMKWWITATVMLAAAAAWVSLAWDTPRRATSQVCFSKELMTKSSVNNGYVPSPRSSQVFSRPVRPHRQPLAITLTAAPVSRPPVVDGRADDAVWRQAEPVETLDALSQRPITLRAVHMDGRIFFLVSYGDASRSISHKTYRWDRAEGVYKPMGDREDTFVFAWSMDGPDIDLSLRSAMAHTADVWFWKAWRTDPVGFADDKRRIVSHEPHERAVRVPSADRTRLYLSRIADAGRSTYIESIVFDYQGPYASRYTHRSPQGSRGDVRAKGQWADGVWTIEFARALNTGSDDDLAFAPGGRYAFVVSCYEMAGGDIEPELDRPMYNAGDGFDRLTLLIGQEEGP